MTRDGRQIFTQQDTAYWRVESNQQGAGPMARVCTVCPKFHMYCILVENNLGLRISIWRVDRLCVPRYLDCSPGAPAHSPSVLFDNGFIEELHGTAYGCLYRPPGTALSHSMLVHSRRYKCTLIPSAKDDFFFFFWICLFLLHTSRCHNTSPKLPHVCVNGSYGS